MTEPMPNPFAGLFEPPKKTTTVDHHEVLAQLVRRMFVDSAIHMYDGSLSLSDTSVHLSGAEHLVIEALIEEQQ